MSEVQGLDNRQPEIATFETRMGWVGLVLTGRGIAASTLFSPRREDVLAQLRSSWPEAVEMDLDQFPDLKFCLCRYADGEAVSFANQKFDLKACTPFQRRVLREVADIPYGQTRRYGEIAEAIGSPGSARAVGQALARNPIPLLIPCHRVLASDGDLRGFSAPGGVSTKRDLLILERAISE